MTDEAPQSCSPNPTRRQFLLTTGSSMAASVVGAYVPALTNSAAGESDSATASAGPSMEGAVPITLRINPTASFNSLSNVLVLKGVVTSRSWLTSDTLRWSWDPTSSVSSGAGTFGRETEV